MTADDVRHVLQASVGLVCLTAVNGEIARVTVLDVAEKDDGDGIVCDIVESNRERDRKSAYWFKIGDICDVRA